MLLTLAVAASSCSTVPEPKVTRYEWPKNEAYYGDPGKPFKPLGLVRTKVEYASLDPNHDEAFLCRNYFNKAVRDLVKRAKDVGGEAVADVKSVVFLVDGRTETHASPECSDDGSEGQVLVQGVALKWTPAPTGQTSAPDKSK